MRIIENSVWKIYYYCNASLDDNFGCNNLLELNVEDIMCDEITDFGTCAYNKDYSFECPIYNKHYYFECPVCHKKTIINDALIPYDIRGIIESNNNSTSKKSIVILKH